MNVNDIAGRAVVGVGCTAEEAEFLVVADFADLLDGAERIRQAHFGAGVFFCGIVNAKSGACREDCRFCAQSISSRTGAEVYPLMDADGILAKASELDGEGPSTFGIVTSGPTLTDAEIESICESIEAVSGKTSLCPCASLGKLTETQLLRLKEAGLTRYHHNLETSQNFFGKICSTHSWAERVEMVRAAKRVGFEVCCGGLFGLGEDWRDRIDLALALRELDVDSVPVNFLNPVAGTPLGERPSLGAEEALRIIALYRFMLPTKNIRVCGGRPVTLAGRQEEMFRAGASSLMTGNYLTTSGISPQSDRAMLARLGLELEG